MPAPLANIDRMALTHEGLDYATLTIDGYDYEISLNLMVALLNLGIVEQWDDESAR